MAEDFMAIASTPNFVNRHKCYGIGFTILELSKLQMYRAWYEKITVKWPDASIIASDTDSYIFNVSTDDIREDLKDPIFANFFDFSTLDVDDVMHDVSRDSKVGYWKIETGSDTILSSTGIRPKVYSLQHISAKMLKEINEKIKIMNIKLKRMKKRELCVRQFTYMTSEMKKLKGMHSFTRHIRKKLSHSLSFMHAFPKTISSTQQKMSLIPPY